jgi:hypothetical protein
MLLSVGCQTQGTDYTESVSVGAKESILPGWESIPKLPKWFTNTGLGSQIHRPFSEDPDPSSLTFA